MEDVLGLIRFVCRLHAHQCGIDASAFLPVVNVLGTGQWAQERPSAACSRCRAAVQLLLGARRRERYMSWKRPGKATRADCRQGILLSSDEGRSLSLCFLMVLNNERARNTTVALSAVIIKAFGSPHLCYMTLDPVNDRFKGNSHGY